MRIYSMTATFGKLSHQTLTLEPGLNIVEAPNEWGKSTWCAFLVAMLYGISTREQTKTGFLADKEHYTPWSGEPMSGRIDLHWNGKDITIERRNKGRGYFNDFKAYETQSGLPVPELTAADCGQTLLGVEQSVFLRAGFLRQSDLPVTADEALRRRLNALVTTGDESGTSDVLAQKLKDLKNRCRFNKKGLLPEAEAERDRLEDKLRQLQMLQEQQATIQNRRQVLTEEDRLLKNHLAALDYQENRDFAEKLAAAKVARNAAAEELTRREAACAALPKQENILDELERLQQLRQTREDLLLQAQLLPPAPEVPAAEDAFRGKDPEQVQKEAALDYQVLQQLQQDLKKPIPIILGGVLAVLGAAALALLPGLSGKIGGGMILAVGIVALLTGLSKQNKLKGQIAEIKMHYRGIPQEQWETAAAAFALRQQQYTQALAQRQRTLEEINRALEENTRQVQTVTNGLPQNRWEQEMKEAQKQYGQLEDAKARCRQAEQFLQSLQVVRKEVAAPALPDSLTDSREHTEKKIAALRMEEQQLHQRLGQCQGQMETLGNRQSIQEELQRVNARIEKLEKVLEAVTWGLQAQQTAAQELQRRFAPRISQRAQVLMQALTEGRYDRLMLDRELQLSAAARGEDTLRSNLWRSSGTADQLYFALRLAVAEELTPDAPLVLDDALIRFDDVRMGAALKLLQDQEKQIILFTCQSREKAWEAAHKEETL